MASRYNTRVTVYRPQISGLFQPGGEVNDEARDITTLIEIEAIGNSIAFIRSGSITGGHRRNVVPSGIYGTRGYVENVSPHALYKHQGTGPVIWPARATYLQLPDGYGWPASRQEFVKGQVGDPWLRDAANAVLSRYGVHVTDADVSFG